MIAASGPNDGSPLLSAAQWLEAMVQGRLAVTLAVLAVAATGLMMLSGRLAIRRGVVVTLGCFMLFGAPAIARGLFASAAAVAGPTELPSPMFDAAPLSAPVPQPLQQQETDPYAGASVAR